MSHKTVYVHLYKTYQSVLPVGTKIYSENRDTSSIRKLVSINLKNGHVKMILVS